MVVLGYCIIRRGSRSIEESSMTNDALREKLDALVRSRIQKKQAQISYSLRQISAGNPLGAETDDTRRTARLALKTGLDRREAESLSTAIQQTAADIDRGAGRPPSRRRGVARVAPRGNTQARIDQPEAVL